MAGAKSSHDHVTQRQTCRRKTSLKKLRTLIGQDMRLVLLVPYSPEINPAERIWDALCEDCIGNTVFASLDAADEVLSKGLRSLASDPARMQSLTGFKWIISISLNAK
jgi:transposase